MHRDKSTKMAKWLFLPNCHFGNFFPVYRFQIYFFLQNDFWLSVMKRATIHFCLKSVSGPVQACQSTYRKEKLNYFKFPS